METKNKKRQAIWRYSFALVVLISGIIFNLINIGRGFLGFQSVGNWLIYVGLIMLMIVTLQLLSKKKRIIDERMQFVATKAARITFLGIILSAFTIMIIDGIKQITIPYSYFMSYFICGIVLIYFISYKILLKYN